ncbi:hypothetical protein FIU88_07815 [Halomonas sp. THAF12]|uniref:hypothetical protein n=1 Tax=Halomonas sp. THAF12 TaxID=2587849 RepID=UPI001267A031|nr:hypothetical protein [Halomonas sp. THAF12]QFT84879.1 hypothetical protein FIU88_07815 [Halomonas sp. THAF12]
MDSSELIHDYRRWQRFQRQAQLDREHRAAWQQLESAGVSAQRTTEAYRSMADKAATQGACYRTLFQREFEAGERLACEGWLFVRRVIAENGATRLRATLLPSFTLTGGTLSPAEAAAESVTLEIFDQLLVDRGLASVARVDRVDASGDSHFITLIDSVRGDLRQHMS